MRLFFTDNPIAGAGFWSGRLTAIGVIGRQIVLLAWPMRLSADYSYNAIPLAVGFTGAVFGGIAVLLRSRGDGGWSYRRDRKVFFLILFGLGALLPTSNLLFPIGTIMAERFLYVPAIAFAGCIAAALWAFRGRVRSPLDAGSSRGNRAGFAARTFARNFDWGSERALFQSAAIAEPASFRPHDAMASIYLRAGQLDDAMREADRTVEILDALPEFGIPADPVHQRGQGL